MYFISMI